MGPRHQVMLTVDTVPDYGPWDLLYHLPILRGSEQFDGSYDFSGEFYLCPTWMNQQILLLQILKGLFHQILIWRGIHFLMP